ncbi:MAG: sugar ABC transporter substrate-binding protein [Rhodocyclales bacterium]|nr:sugar ABC transporter substrate-binding protein [Rhodocyclales bacterium]
MKKSQFCLAAAITVLAASAHADGEKVAFFTKNLTNPFFQVVRLGADSAAKQMNASVQHYVPTKPDSIPEQMSQIEDVIVKKPDAIVFTPVDYKAMVAGVSKMNAAGIPVVNVTDRSESGNFVAFVGANDFNLGLETARFMLKAMGGKGNVVIIEGVKASLTNIDRVRGFKQALGEFPNAKLVASQPGNYQRIQALQVMENLMQSFPQIDGVLAANDAMATGVIEAMDAANRKALVIGINGTKEAIDAIKAGKMLATGEYAAFEQGCVSTMAALRHLRKLPVVKEVVFPASVVHKGNYQPYDIPADKRSCPKWEDVVK